MKILTQEESLQNMAYLGYKLIPGKKLGQEIFKNSPPRAVWACPTYTGEFIVFYDRNEKMISFRENDGYQNYGIIKRG